MGTSTKLPGPVGGSWRAARATLTRSLIEVERVVTDGTASVRNGEASAGGAAAGVPGPAERWQAVEAARHGSAFLAALESELRADAAAFGLVETSRQVGAGLINVLEALSLDGPVALGPLVGATADERAELFVRRFVARTAGQGGVLTDAVARRAASQSAETLLTAHPVLRHAVETGTDAGGTPIGDGLFCEIYRLFFADLVTGFLTTVIAGKITLMQVLPVLDPAGEIANWLAGKVVEMIPTPCHEKEERDDGSSVADLGRELARDAILRAFGIEGGNA